MTLETILRIVFFLFLLLNELTSPMWRSSCNLQHAIKDGSAKSTIEKLSQSEHYGKVIKCLKLRYNCPRIIHRMIDPWRPTTKESYWQRATLPPQCCHTASSCLEVDGIWPIKTFHLIYSQAQIGHHNPIWVAETVSRKRKCHTSLILCHMTWRYLYSLCMNYLSSGHLCKLVHKCHQCQKPHHTLLHMDKSTSWR